MQEKGERSDSRPFTFTQKRSKVKYAIFHPARKSRKIRSFTFQGADAILNQVFKKLHFSKIYIFASNIVKK